MKTTLQNLLEKSLKEELMTYIALHPENFETLLQLALIKKHQAE